jgi:hypothetical protein
VSLEQQAECARVAAPARLDRAIIDDLIRHSRDLPLRREAPPPSSIFFGVNGGFYLASCSTISSFVKHTEAHIVESVILENRQDIFRMPLSL